MTRNDRLFLILSGLMLVLCAVLLGFNALTHQYQIVFYPYLLFRSPLLSLCLALYPIGVIFYKRYPNMSLFFKTLGMLYIVALLMLFADMAVSTTPFALDNQWINQVDHWLGFNLASFISSIREHSLINKSLASFYVLLFSALKLIPLTLAALGQRTQVYRFTISFLISCILGFGLYYFLPSTDAASMIHSIKFTPLQYHLTTQFQQIHHYEPSRFYEAGLISFPSYHAIWAVLLAYACWPRKWLFYPVTLFSTLVIIAALASGWHFLTDIIGGVIVAILSIYITHVVMNIRQKFRRKCETHKAMGARRGRARSPSKLGSRGFIPQRQFIPGRSFRTKCDLVRVFSVRQLHNRMTALWKRNLQS